MSTSTQLKPAAAASLATWHAMIAKRDLSDLRSIVHPDASFRSPMAIAVIGGLITSTALSLLFVPVVFSLIDGVKRRLEGRMDKLFHGQHGHEEPAATEDRPA